MGDKERRQLKDWSDGDVVLYALHVIAQREKTLKQVGIWSVMYKCNLKKEDDL